ncbi:SAM-dependent methyltransferase [Nocardioides sp. zg-579]|uniref:SAM-dependent methyltransferase n=1 Tax=Nocardioides marmotae TaxID=2663857 RepID=A0A6I3JDB5_9ACTN|nr:class I SAM-dependent methyltransferase [Nocardioides marmotae]MCR6032426.1 SAM-dependent methyltransferase [Gordonia jinghuaiqii]MTB96075.1 SAM-dependent methyltransferase [Nocardioides marmotae]QKE02605.1 SAM-dependent methyltransferase [Nocardioides marmotae]
MDLDAFRWLLTEPGQALLARAGELAGSDPLAAQTALRREASAEHAAAALTQARLRVRAEAKFGDLAARMYFTADGLEQATRLAVATHRAARLQAYAARTLVDLGCGIGGDLVAAARAGLTCAGVDLDPVRVAVAEANLAALDLPGAVMVADATTVDPSPFDVAFADPARRGARGRTFDVDDWTPPWSFVERLLRRDSCVKVAPGIPHDIVPAGVEAEWVSDHGEVKEAALWSGGLATTARRATVIGDGGLASLTDEDAPALGEDGVGVRAVGRYLYEPDGAVVRAGLVTAVAAAVQGGLVDEHIAYVTGDAAYRSPFARGYEVLEELPYREKALRAALRERGIGTLTIKKRGVEVVPEQLRKRLALSGTEEGTLVLTRVAGAGTALLVRPLA